MKYFTPALYARLQLPGEAEMDAADADWDKAVARYDRRLKTIWPALPEALRFLLEKLYLHDAEVLSMGRQGKTVVFLLQLDVPPQELVLITYRLTEEPAIDQAALAPEHRSEGVAWMHDEVDLSRRQKQRSFSHAILLSNGWEIRLCFHEVQVVVLQRLLPVVKTPADPALLSTQPVVPESA